MWAQIYYLFRTGHVQDALQFARDNELNLNPADRNFVMYLNAYWQSEDRTLPSALQDRLRTDFNNRIRYSSDTVDPYKLTLFKIIGQCELTKRTTPVIGAVEDFIWLHVSFRFSLYISEIQSFAVCMIFAVAHTLTNSPSLYFS